MGKYLSQEERTKLLQVYRDDRLNAAPPNILDETLINVYGTEEQKARLQGGAKEEQGKADEATSAEPAPAPKPQQSENELMAKAINDYVDLFGNVPPSSFSLSQMHEAIRAKILSDELTKKTQGDKESNAVAAVMQEKKAKTVTIEEISTGEKTIVPLYTWDNFISKHGTHKIAVETPIELL